MANSAPSDESRVALTARIEVELQAQIDGEAEIDSKPGADVTRSQMVRVLLWEALSARKAVRAASATRAA